VDEHRADDVGDVHLMRAPRRLVADEQGFTLVELLAAMVIGSIVLTVLMNVFLTGMSNSNKVTDRVEATQRARIATDRLTSLLQAQVCVDGVAPISAATATAVTFTANIGAVTGTPTRFTLRYDAATRNLWEDTVTSTVPTTGVNAGKVLFTGTLRSRLIATQVLPYNGAIFTYYMFDPDTGMVGETPLAVPLSTADRPSVIRVGTALTAVPERTKLQDPRATTITGQAIVGGADNNNLIRGPKC
jgi:prepilin-type N-terminal cleavage/methylation domain-containing protein